MQNQPGFLKYASYNDPFHQNPFIGELNLDYSDYAPLPSTSPAESSQVGLSAVNTVPRAVVPSLNLNTPSPNIISPGVNVEVIVPTPQAPNNGASAPPNGGFSYSQQQLDNGWWTNYGLALFSPSSFGTAARVTTPTSLQVAQGIGIFGLSVVTGGLAAEGAAAFIGADAAATWGGTFLVGAVGGGAGSFFGNAVSQATGDQPFSFTQLAEQTLIGAATGGAINVGLKAVGGLISSVLQNSASSEASTVGNTASEAAASPRTISLNVLQDNCFLAGTQVVVGTDSLNEDMDHPIYFMDRSTAMLETTGSDRLAYLTTAIERLKEGDTVLSSDEFDLTVPLQLRTVERVFVRTAYHLTILTIRSSSGQIQTIFTTSEHPFYCPQDGWIESRDLKVGDELHQSDGGASIIIGTRSERHPRGITVYNLRVADSHTYFVREGGTFAEPIWVHNASYPAPSGGWGAGLGEAPEGMIKPHGHHILFKSGIGGYQQRLVVIGQRILWRVGIDPIYGLQNLVWAPNVAGQHTAESLIPVVQSLISNRNASSEVIKSILNEFGQIAASR
jgi:hypothetical protein